MSTTTSRPANSMTNTVRDNRYSGFTSCSNNRISEPASLGSSFGKANNTWQSNNEAWTVNNIGYGTSITKRDNLKTSVESSADDSSDVHSGSSALAESSEAEPWLDRPWNHMRNNSQKIQLQNENILPPNSQKAFPFPNFQNIIEAQNKYQKSTQSTFGHRVSYSRSHPKNPGSLDTLLAPYKFIREDTVKLDKNEKASQPYLNFDKFGTELSRYLPTEGTQSKDGSVITSGASDTELNSNSTLFGNATIQSNLASKNIISSSLPSQSSSYTSLESSHTRQTDAHRFDIPSSSSNLGDGIESDTEDISSSPNLRPRRSHNKSSLGLHYFSSPTKTTVWNENPQVTNKKERFSYRIPQNQSYNEKAYGFIERGLASSSSTENNRCLNMATNSYSVPSVIDRYDFNNTRIPQGPNNLERRPQNGHSTYSPAYVLDAQIQNNITPYFYELPRATLRSDQLNLACGYPILIPPYQSPQMILAHSAKDQDVGTGFRSVLLEDFRNNTKFNKKYELKDLYFHVVEFSGDQHGSRFIQTKLETANSDEKEQIFREIQPNALQLMTDVYGNYVIQKLFEHGNQVQKRMLAQQLKNHVMELSLQMYGCRVVQKALEHVLDDQQSRLVEELQVDILKCIKDQNGNHVVQKAIERVPSKYIQFIIEAFRGKVEVLAVHPYGCRVIQRILEFCKPHDQANILKELHDCLEMLISDQYGNYVIQHVIQHGALEDRDKIQNLVSGKLLKFSKHKFASNVVERCIIFGTEEQRRHMVFLLTSSNIDGTNPLQLMMKDQFGNYVIQKLLAKLNGNEKSIFLSAMKTQLPQIKKFNYGKQIDVMEKLLLNSSQSSQYGCSSVKTSPSSASTRSDSFVSKIGSISDTGMMEMRKSFAIENKPKSEMTINIP
ncbi:putative pumilio domain-containing protein [Erysiphe neolycopersici]|uniref:Pumilio homology domain family member 3 n=1 Tax=Erysiphe neolycopersici TaxID=212602 RepID=A0A420I0B1_9PEZI|nr:putative pumilio domain-containing protein [Erysiphe neolycopersici]